MLLSIILSSNIGEILWIDFCFEVYYASLELFRHLENDFCTNYKK